MQALGSIDSIGDLSQNTQGPLADIAGSLFLKEWRWCFLASPRLPYRRLPHWHLRFSSAGSCCSLGSLGAVTTLSNRRSAGFAWSLVSAIAAITAGVVLLRWPPSGAASYHDVSVDGYFACWVDPQRKVSVVVYGVTATYNRKPSEITNPELINDEILNLMKSAKLQPVN